MATSQRTELNKRSCTCNKKVMHVVNIHKP